YDDQVNQTVVSAADAVRNNRTGTLRERSITTLDSQGQPSTERWTVQQQLQEATTREQARIDRLVANREITP
ncbi:hypothetical protein, partial [Stenotrophomonas maltophilia]|uniref:hypothetical protein n=1 Tax=Stenotrophomonas maltophilia TaxID=40324 RepID=UPI0013D913AF